MTAQLILVNEIKQNIQTKFDRPAISGLFYYASQ